MEHVAVTGVGIVSPIGSTRGVFWQTLARRQARDRSDAGALDAFRKRALGRGRRRLSRAELAAAGRAAEYRPLHAVRDGRRARSAGSAPPRSAASRTAVIIGNTMGGFPLVAEAQTRFLDGARNVTPKLMALVIPNMASALDRDALEAARTAARDQHGVRVLARRDRSSRGNDRTRRDRRRDRRRQRNAVKPARLRKPRPRRRALAQSRCRLERRARSTSIATDS